MTASKPAAPIWSVYFMAATFLNEVPNAGQAAGAAVILLGVVLGTKKSVQG